jgi:PAS domain S-box-containing protein
MPAPPDAHMPALTVDAARSWRRARPWLALAAAAGLLSVAIPQLPLPARVGNALGNLLQLGASALAAWLCIAQRRSHSGHARTGWLLLGLGAGAWSLGQVGWTWYEVVLGAEVPLPGLNDVGYLALYPFAIAGLLLLSPLAERHLVVRASLVLDGVLSALAVFVIAWPLALQAPFQRIDDPLAAAVTVAYPLADVVLLGLVGGILMRRRDVWRSGIGLAYVSFACLLVADLGWTTGIFQDSYATGQAADAGWIVGFLLLAAATRAPMPAQAPGSGVYAQVVGRILPLAAVLLGMAGFAIGRLRGLPAGPGWNLSMASLVLLALWRQALVAKEFVVLAAEREAAEGRYDTMVENASEGILRATWDGRLLMANLEFANIVGYDSVAALKAGVGNLDELYPDPSERKSLLEAVAAQGVVRGREVRLRRRDGQVRWVNVNVRAQATPGAMELHEFVHDVTDLHLLAHDLKRTRRTLFVISQFNQALVRATDEKVLLQGVCDSLTREGGYRMAWVGVGQEDPERSVAPLAVSGADEGYVAKVRATWKEGDPRGQGPAGRAIREGKRQVVQDVVADPGMALWRSEAVARRFASACALPLDLGPYGRAALLVYADETAAFGADEVKLLDELALDLAYGITSMRTGKAKRETEIEYRSLFDNMGEGVAHCRMIRKDGEAVDWEYLHVNAAFPRLTGLEGAQGKRVTELIPDIRGTNRDLFAIYDRVARGGEPERIETEVPGVGRWFEISVYSPVRDEFVAVFSDITARKVAEAGLRSSEELNRHIVEESPLGIVRTALDGSFLTANPAAVAIFGTALVGRKAQEFYADPAQLAQRPTLLRQAESKEGIKGVVMWMRRPDGQRFAVRATSHAMRGRTGSVEAYEGFFEDITEQLTAEQRQAALDLERRGLEMRLAAIVESSTDAIFSKDMNGIVTTWNHGAERMYGWSAAEAVGQPVHELIFPAGGGEEEEEEEEEEEDLLREIAAGRPYRRDVARRVRKDGSALEVSLSASPIRDADGKVVGVSVSAHDIGEARRAEAALRRSEAMLNDAQELSKVGGWSLDVASGKVTWTREVFRIHEVPETFDPSSVGRDVRFYTAESQARLEPALRAATEQGLPFDLEMRLNTARGHQRTVRAIGIPEFDGSRVVRVRGNIQDITEQREAFERLRASEARLKEAQALAKVGSWELDLRSNILTWSDQNYRIFGVEPGVFGATYDFFLSTVHPDERALVDRMYRESVAKRVPYSIEHRLLMPDGSVKWVHERCETSYDRDGKPLRSLGTTQDITQQKAAEAARADLEGKGREVKRLEELNRMRMDFLNTAAHDLKTPLTPLKLQMAALRARGLADAKQRESLDVMDRSVNRFQALIEDMLDAARLQAGKLKLKRSNVALAPLVQETVASFQEAIRQEGLQVDVRVGAGTVVDADPNKLMQILMNLVSNAVKYTPKGGAVQVRAVEEEGVAHLSVRDSGLGMDSEQLGRLFQPFVRLHEGIPGTAKGTGLGLYISKGIAESHGGRIWAESEGPGLGSTFHLAWPLAKAASPPQTGTEAGVVG